MDLLMRRRALMQSDNGTTFDEMLDYARIIMRGDGDNAVDILQAQYKYIIDGIVYNGVRYHVFGDNGLHDVFVDMPYFPIHAYLNDAHHVVIDFSNTIKDPNATYNQPFKFSKIPHVDLILRNTEYVDLSGSWAQYGWNKTRVHLYVPQALVDTYSANQYWNKGTIYAIEGSKYEKRLPIEKLGLE